MNASVHTIPSAVYHADELASTPALSASIARTLINASPLHAWQQHPKLNPNYRRDDDAKYDVGTAVHALLLEGDDKCFVVHADSWRTKDAKDARDQARADGLVPLLVGQYEEAQTMLATIKERFAQRHDTPPVFTNGRPEQTIVWEEDGVVMKARVDWLRDDLTAIDDLKTTTRLANPREWERTLFSLGYDVQAAFYRRAVRALGGDADFRLCVAECSPPYAVSVLSLAPDAQSLADAKVDKAVRMWRHALTSGEWPGWPAETCYIEAPGYELMRWAEREDLETA